jgi:hypothetical protein
MFRSVPLALAVFVATACTYTGNACAEVIELKSGDIIQADLLQVTEKTLRIRHELFGEVDIPRAKVHAIVMTDPETGTTKKVNPDGSKAKQETPKQVIDRLVNKDFGPKAVKELEKGARRQQSPRDAVEQLKREGIDPDLNRSLHMMLPGFGAPKVQDYFNSRVDGLMQGSIDIDDIRKDAIGARDQLREIMDDLGQDGAALQGYYSILDNFIQKTKPADSKQPNPRPQPKQGPQPKSDK